MTDSRPTCPPERDGLRRTHWLLGILAAFATVWFLRETPMVTMPALWALLVALAVWPVQRKVRGMVPSRLGWLGPVAAMAVVAAVIVAFGLGLWIAGEQVVRLGREVGPQLESVLARTGLGGMLETEQPIGEMLSKAGSNLLSALGAATQAVTGILLIFFLTLLMLTEAEEWDDKIAAATDGGERRWSEIARSIGQKFRIFFLTRLLLGTITALLYVAWLALFGIDYLLLWGLLTVLLNFIPTIGSIISGALPVGLALVQKDLGTAALIAAGLLVIEQVMGNFVDPKLMGRQLSLSPLVVLLALAFWSWVWGVPGAFLAVPMTVLIVVVFAHFKPLERIALLFTRERSLNALDNYRKVD